MNFLNPLMNSFDKTDVTSFQNKIQFHRETVNEMTYIRLARQH